jgi:hypothetical protein
MKFGLTFVGVWQKRPFDGSVRLPLGNGRLRLTDKSPKLLFEFVSESDNGGNVQRRSSFQVLLQEVGYQTQQSAPDA